MTWIEMIGLLPATIENDSLSNIELDVQAIV